MGVNETKDESMYDIVLDIRRISDVSTSTGWPLMIANTKNFTTEEEAMKAISMDQKATMVGVFGLFNRGKTFLLNQIAETNLPSSKKIHTKGISFVNTKDLTVGGTLPVVLVDTAGTNTPLERNYWKTGKFEDRKKVLAEKKITEELIQHISFLLCDVIIVVVNEITWPDQEFIEILRRKLILSDKVHKTLYVVHNYSDITTEEDLISLWRQNVVSSFNGEVQEVPVITVRGKETAIIFKQDLVVDGDIPTVHYFLANDNSPAGNIWNPVVYALLRQNILACNVPYKKSLKESLLDSVYIALKACTHNPNEPKIIWRSLGVPPSVDARSRKPVKRAYSQKRISLAEWKNNEIVTEPSPISSFSVVCDGNLELTSTVDFSNFSLSMIPSQRRPSTFFVHYDYFQTSSGFTVIVDLPGVTKEDISTTIKHTERTELHISGQRKIFYLYYKKSDGKLEYQKADDHQLRQIVQKSQLLQRCGGVIDILIPLPSTIDTDLSEGKEVLKDGLYVIFLPTKKVNDTRKVDDDF